MTGEDGVDDAQSCSPQCATGFGEIHDAIGDVGNLGFAGPIREANVGFDAALGEERFCQSWILTGHPHTLGEIFHLLK